MKEIIKNKKMIYCIIAVIIVIGIIATYVLRLNFSLMYSSNTRINIYIGKDCNIEDIKQICTEVFGNQEIEYQKIEIFNDAVAITVKEVTEEQEANLKEKIKEKYELESADDIISKSQVGHLRGRDIIKPYLVPMVITTIIILAYIGIRYASLGIYKTIGILLSRIILSEALFLSIIAIARLQISIYTMPVAILLYIAVVMATVTGFQKQVEKVAKESKK